MKQHVQSMDKLEKQQLILAFYKDDINPQSVPSTAHVTTIVTICRMTNTAPTKEAAASSRCAVVISGAWQRPRRGDSRSAAQPIVHGTTTKLTGEVRLPF